MLRSTISFLLLAGALAAPAGTDGYLRQGPPLALRFAKAQIPPPPVNELILALGKPPVVEVPETSGASVTEGALAGMSDALKAAIQDLISKPAASPTATTVSTDSPTVASEVSGPAEILPQQAFATEAPVDEGGIMAVLSLFENNRRNRGQRNSAVIAAPAAFLPPQPLAPAPSSRAVYTSP